MNPSNLNFPPQFASRAEFLRAESHARRWWVSFVVGMLTLQVAIGMTALYLSLSDPTIAVVPNYHQSAVNWDITRRALQLTDSLQWQMNIDVVTSREGEPTSELQVQVLAADGVPIEGMNVTARVYHHARGNEIHSLALKETQPGYYAGGLKLAQVGLWQIDLQMESQHGIAAHRSELYVR
ncbi:FixH family protein [Aureliella helgolandensis]|uniref:FixH n=1 Tax=Aureliella helgolandensis TaxID=2527968 RepID=A0A518FZU8_9BACT|nr:FixH family protein [Aureliella helgolandensis]QDV21784.1 FixH [Aureliella helgolandensis]